MYNDSEYQIYFELRKISVQFSYQTYQIGDRNVCRDD